nr:immunoglobulin heavy chain junction region [Macaca mulatta]MOY21096.1 immunoglobulin heavy chain junction region [Macaca mulatta]MOY21344.1 immunoglobulin heavy chain junction region [Macaca mulatta]MOY21679.1 immunoglobulin heavy chain junction region [Macaca mulatta]MOY22148.1 immunoglobulin heavy chain junction region [Macaca mulatta]
CVRGNIAASGIDYW